MQSVKLAKKRVSACFFVFQKIGAFLLRRRRLSCGFVILSDLRMLARAHSGRPGAVEVSDVLAVLVAVFSHRRRRHN